MQPSVWCCARTIDYRPNLYIHHCCFCLLCRSSITAWYLTRMLACIADTLFSVIIHFAWSVAKAICIVITDVCLSVCLFVCVSARLCISTLLHLFQCNFGGNGWRGYSVAHLEIIIFKYVHWLCCYDNRMRNVSGCFHLLCSVLYCSVW